MGLTMTKTSLRLITPPADLPVTLAAAKDYLRVSHDGEDAGISAMIAAATNLLDGRGGILGRCLEAATYELLLDRFPEAEIRLPLGPVASVTSIAFTDLTGAEGTVDPGSYALNAAETFGGGIVPIAGFAWPATMDMINAVRIRFVAGTGAPEGVKQAILDMVAARFDTRGEGKMLTPGIVADLAPFRRPVVL
jgi:uncharacterized phiE125 gp8 family phage protein